MNDIKSQFVTCPPGKCFRDHLVIHNINGTKALCGKYIEKIVQRPRTMAEFGVHALAAAFVVATKPALLVLRLIDRVE